MSTLAQMRSRIADDLNRTDLNSQIDKAINRAIRYYANGYRFWFNETTATFVTVANQFNYSTGPSDLAEIDYVKIALSANNNLPITPRTYNYIQTITPGNLTGTPTDYAYYKENFWLYPIPNQVWTITVSYTKFYAEMTADANTNDFTEEAEDLIESRAEWWLYSRVIKDYDAAQVAKQAEESAFIALTNETTRLTKSGRVVPTQF